MGRHAQFDPGMLEVPEPDPHHEAGCFEVRVKRDDTFTSLALRWHPLDVAGWQGDLCPVRLNILSHRPVTSPRYHMPPSANATFVNDGFAICSFVPRPLEEDPDVLRVPFYHANIDADEVLFYHAGNFFSRAGIGEGYLTLHPQDLHHARCAGSDLHDPADRGGPGDLGHGRSVGPGGPARGPGRHRGRGVPLAVPPGPACLPAGFSRLRGPRAPGGGPAGDAGACLL